MRELLRRIAICGMAIVMVLETTLMNVVAEEIKQAVEEEYVIDNAMDILERTDVSGEECVQEQEISLFAAGENIRIGTLGDNNGIQWSYDESTKTLTVTGEDSGLNGTWVYNDLEHKSPFYDICSDVEKIVMMDCKLKDSIYALYGRLEKLKSVEFNNCDTSNVTDMCGMFYGCSSLTVLDLSSFNTGNVTDMRSMFSNCSSLTELNLSSFNTSNVTDMGSISFGDGMFSNCSSLTELDLSSFNTGNVTDMEYMFSGCSKLTELDLSGFSTGNVTDMEYMFSGCSKLTELDLSSFNTGNVICMRSMFSGCSSLIELDLSGFNTGNVIYMRSMFSDCSSLIGLDLRSFNTSNVTEMARMFSGCRSLTELNLNGFDTGNVTDMTGMFEGCSSLTELDISSFNTSNVTYMGGTFNGWGMFEGCSSLTELNLSNFNTGNVTSMGFMFRDCSSLAELGISSFNTGNVTDMNGMFYGCSSLTELDLSNFNTGSVTDMGWMFANCHSLTELDISSFNTGNVTDMVYMFGGCSSLTELDLSNFNTGNVIYMDTMFWSCSKLTELDLSSFNTGNVTDMNRMFLQCKSLTELDLSSFNTGNVTDMNGMFYFCFSLAELDISSFNTGNVTDMGEMFYGCSLTELDLSNFNTGSVTDMSSMFSGCNNLTKLDLSNFNTSNVTDMDSMLDNCCELTIIHTPKVMALGQCIKLPDTYGDSKGNLVTELTKNTCNMVLRRILVADYLPNILFALYSDTEELAFCQEKGYLQKSFNLDVSVMCMLGINNEVPSPCENVEVEITLPEGLSFEQNTDSRVFTKNLGTMSLEGNSRADMSFTIYVDNEVVPEQFEIQAKLTADGYEYARLDSFVIPVTIQESDVWHAEFKDPTTYQASYVYDEQTDMFEKDFYGDTPSIKIYEQAEENGLVNSVEAWNEFQDAFKAMDDLSSVVDIPCRKRDMYQAIIFSVFEVSSELSDYTYNTSEVKDAKKILGVIKEIASAQYGIVVAESNDLSNLTLDQRLKLGEITKTYFSDEWKTSVQTKEVSEIFDAIKYIDNFLKYLEYIVNCYNLREMSEGYKAILRDMYENCPLDNQELRIALSDCIVCIEASEAVMVAKMAARGVDVAGREIIKIGLKELWTEIKTDIIAANPYAALLWASYKYSTLVTNKVFGTDAIAENTVKMGAILEIRELILKSYEQHKEDFRVNREETNALRYLAAIDIFYQCLDEDCEIAYGFVDAVSDSMMGKLEEFFGCSSYEDVKSVIRIYQHSYVLGHESVKTGWLNVLMEDYPEQYEKYKYLQTESENRIKKRYHVACPVDVYVYDLLGELVASAVGSAAYCKEDVPLTVMVVGDEKDIYFQGNDEQYTIKYVGTDSGTMDITIEEYDSEQTVSREIKHVDVPLTDGTCYQSTEKLAEENEYVLEDSNNSGKALSPIVDTKEEEQQKYTLQVKGGYVWDGTRVGFEAEYYAGEKATVYAVASEGYDFVHWEENGEVVSEDVTYTFTMDADKHLQAVYKEKGSTKVTDIFEDVKEGAWYVDAVQYAYDKGIMVGMGNLFQPNGAVTREQFVQVLYNNIGKPSVEGIENKFSDVKESWYTDAVLWASTAGIVSGYPNGKYGVGDNITREQMALMLYRYADLNNYDLTVNEDLHKQYPDGETVSDWAESAVDWAITQGIISGKGTGSDVSKLKIDPQGAATRAECASMMMKLLTKNQ